MGVLLKTTQKVYTTIHPSIYDAGLVQATALPLGSEVELDGTINAMAQYSPFWAQSKNGTLIQSGP